MNDNFNIKMIQANKQTQRPAVKIFNQRNNSDIFQKSKKIINKIHENQKRKSLTYRSYQPLADKKIIKISSIQINQSINVIRQRSHSQKSKTSNIQNRLNYLRVSTSRQQKLVNIAKTKYLRVNQIRHQSFTQKNILAKQKGIVLLQHNNSIKEKVNRIKSQKCLSQISQREIQMKNKRQAQGVRKKKQMNQYIIKSRKQDQQKRKRQNAQKIHKSLIISSQKLKNLSKNKIEAGRQNHKRQIIHQFQNTQIQKKLNQKLIKKFKAQASAIFDQKIKRQKQMQYYEQYLGLSIGGKKIQKSRKLGTAPTNIKSRTTALQGSTTSRMSSKSKIGSFSKSQSKQQNRAQDNGFYLTNPQTQN